MQDQKCRLPEYILPTETEQDSSVNLRNKGQLGWQKLSNCHELKHTLGVIELDGVVGELAGDVALPVEDAHCHHRPHQH